MSFVEGLKRVGLDAVTGGGYEVYKKLYEDPANDQKAALADAQAKADQYATFNRNLQLQGLNRALSFYGPARDILREMTGGGTPSGFGAVSQGPTALPTSPAATTPSAVPGSATFKVNPALEKK